MSEEELEQNLNKEIMVEKIVPQTYEQLKAMYQAQMPQNETPEPTEEIHNNLQTEEIGDDADYNEGEEEDYDDNGEETEEEQEDDENVEGELLEEDEEISDVDDNELMKRLESRYGRLLLKPESDDDQEEEESWTSNKLKL